MRSYARGILRKSPFFCGGPFKERSPTPLQTFLGNAYIGGYHILQLNGIRSVSVRLAFPPQCCALGISKKEIYENGNELLFSYISFLALRLRRIRECAKCSSPYIDLPIQSSLKGGPGGISLRKRDSPRIKSHLIPKTAEEPSWFSILRRRLYLAVRSPRQGAPNLTKGAFMATAISATAVSSVSPERCETIAL